MPRDVAIIVYPMPCQVSVYGRDREDDSPPEAREDVLFGSMEQTFTGA